MALRWGYTVFCCIVAAGASRTVVSFAQGSVAADTALHLAPHNQTLSVADTDTDSMTLADIAGEENDSSHLRSHDVGDRVGRASFAEQAAHIEKRVTNIEERTTAAKATLLEAKEELAQKFGVVAGEFCPTADHAINIGCNIGCHCHWHQQCYPRNVFVGDGKGGESLGERFDVGVCQRSMPNLMVICVGCFFGLLACIISVRVVLLGSMQAEMEREMPPSFAPKAQQAVEIKVAGRINCGNPQHTLSGSVRAL